jgi:flavodoxin/ferredoxin
MKTAIFYYSATGNSLAAARNIAEQLGETTLVSIPQALQGAATTDATRIGFVFPVHMWGVPIQVVRFIQKLAAPTDAYIFAVATSGGMPCGTLKQTKQLLAEQGKRLAAGFSLSMVNNCTTIAPAVPPDKQHGKLAAAKRQLERICLAIKKGSRHVHQGIPGVNWLFYRFMYLRALPKVPAMDKNYFVDENCNGCGICMKACQAHNISLENKKPVWRQHCEACFACLQWCPKESIQLGKTTIGRRRYHHPEIRLADICREAL